MQSGKSSTNHIQSILNDHDFAPLRKFSFLVLVTPNGARFGRVLPATAQTAPAEAALSSRARLGCGGNGPSALPTHSLKGMNHVVSDDCDGDVNALLERPMKASLQSVILSAQTLLRFGKNGRASAIRLERRTTRTFTDIHIVRTSFRCNMGPKLQLHRRNGACNSLRSTHLTLTSFDRATFGSRNIS